MANEYVTSTALKATLNMTGESYADADIAAAVTAASRLIDDTCNRRFWLDANASQVRHYTASSATTVDIDDVVTITSVKVDSDGDYSYATTLTADADYLLWPYNAADDGRPYTQLKANPRSSYVFDPYPKWVQVTCQFGWAAVPASIAEAATLLASRLLKRAREAPFGVTAVGIEGAGMRVPRIDPDVDALLAPFRKLTV